MMLKKRSCKTFLFMPLALFLLTFAPWPNYAQEKPHKYNVELPDDADPFQETSNNNKDADKAPTNPQSKDSATSKQTNVSQENFNLNLLHLPIEDLFDLPVANEWIRFPVKEIRIQQKNQSTLVKIYYNCYLFPVKITIHKSAHENDHPKKEKKFNFHSEFIFSYTDKSIICSTKNSKGKIQQKSFLYLKENPDPLKIFLPNKIKASFLNLEAKFYTPLLSLIKANSPVYLERIDTDKNGNHLNRTVFLYPKKIPLLHPAEFIFSSPEKNASLKKIPKFSREPFLANALQQPNIIISWKAHKKNIQRLTLLRRVSANNKKNRLKLSYVKERNNFILSEASSLTLKNDRLPEIKFWNNDWRIKEHARIKLLPLQNIDSVLLRIYAEENFAKDFLIRKDNLSKKFLPILPYQTDLPKKQLKQQFSQKLLGTEYLTKRKKSAAYKGNEGSILSPLQYPRLLIREIVYRKIDIDKEFFREDLEKTDIYKTISFSYYDSLPTASVIKKKRKKKIPVQSSGIPWQLK